MSENIRTLVFDLDGTLVDSNRDLVPALNKTTGLDGVPPMALADVGYVVGKGAFQMLKRAFDFHDMPLEHARHKELLAIFLKNYEDKVADHTVYFDGVLDAMDDLANQGWNFAICTNKYEHLARKLIDKIGGGERFKAITGGDTFSVKKPEPEHILETIRLAGGHRDHSVMVGDSINDIDAAKAAAIPVIAVDFGYTDIPVSELGPDIIISHFDELADAANELVRGR